MSPKPQAVSVKSNSRAQLLMGLGLVIAVFLAYILFRPKTMVANTLLAPLTQIPSPSPIILTDAKTGMHTYTSDAGRFSLSFPANYQLHVNEAYRAATQSYSPVDNLLELDAPGQNKPYILVQYSGLAGPISLHDFVLNTTECDAIEEATPLNITAGAIEALGYLNVSCNVPSESRVYFLHDQEGYTVNFNQTHVTKQQVTTFLQSISFK